MNQPGEHNAVPSEQAQQPTQPKQSMQQPMQPQTMYGVEEIRARWRQQIADAKGAWGKLTENELLKSEGHQQKLSELVRGRYVISRHEADRQVKRFFNEREF